MVMLTFGKAVALSFLVEAQLPKAYTRSISDSCVCMVEETKSVYIGKEIWTINT